MRMLARLMQSPDGRPETAALISGGMRKRRRLERAIRHLDSHFALALNTPDLARIAGLSVSQFRRLFREQTGHTPMEYLRRVRVATARQLLGNIDLLIKEIAAQCGFDDPYHFSKVFHEIDGLSPSLYREALLAGRR